MAVSQSSQGPTLLTSATVSSRGLTVAGWWRLAGAGSGNNPMFSVGTDVGDVLSFWLNSNGVVSLSVTSSSSVAISEFITIPGGWYFGGFTTSPDGTTCTGFFSAIGPGGQVGQIMYGTPLAVTSFTAPVRVLGDVLANWANGAVENVSVWTSALTDSQLKAVMPIRGTPPAGAWSYWPLLTTGDLTDHSGNGRNLTATGTHATTAGPPGPAPPTAASLNILCVGDSITAGYNGTVDVPSLAYPADLAALRPQDTVANHGHDGANTLTLISDFAGDVQANLSASKTNLVLFAEGVNDIGQGATATTTLARFLLMVINAHAVGAYIIIANILPTSQVADGPTSQIVAFNTAINAAPFQGADGFRDNGDDPFFANPSNTAVFVDGLHLTPAGYAHLAANWSTSVNAFLSGNQILATQVIVLDQPGQADGSFTVRGVFWVAPPPNRVVPAPGFVSAVNGIQASDLASLQSGALIELPFDTSKPNPMTGVIAAPYTSLTTLAKVEADLINLRTAIQAQVNAQNPPLASMIGMSFNGTAWAPYTTIGNVPA